MKIEVNPDDLRPVVEAVVSQVLARLEADREQFGSKLAYSEAEAAQLVGLSERQLADERRRGRIRASAIVGRRIRYLRSDLIDYLLSRRWCHPETANST